MPTRLRETVAWLVALDPQRNHRVVDLDPGAVVAVLATAVLAGCGTDDSAATESSTSASATVAPQQYAGQVIEAFRSTYAAEQAAGDNEYAAVTADWAAFGSVVKDLEPPEGEETDHDRMLAAFGAYVDAREEANSVCTASPGLGGPCFTSVSAAGDQWRAALERAYALPGLSWGTLLG